MKPIGRCRAGGWAEKNNKKKLYKSRLVCHSITLPCKSARRLKWNLRAAITWLPPAPVFSRRLLDISLTSFRHPRKKKKRKWKKKPRVEKVSKAFWNVAPQRSQLQMILEINSALKKGKAYRAMGGGTFLSVGPTPSTSHSAERCASVEHF